MFSCLTLVFNDSVSTWLVKQMHAWIVSRPRVRLMPREDIAQIIWCYFVGYNECHLYFVILGTHEMLFFGHSTKLISQ